MAATTSGRGPRFGRPLRPQHRRPGSGRGPQRRPDRGVAKHPHRDRRGGRRRHPGRGSPRQLPPRQPGSGRGRRCGPDRCGRPASGQGTPRARHHPQLRPGRRRQLQSEQPGDRRTRIRVRTGSRRPAHRGLDPRPAVGRCGRLRQALSRAWGHRRRLASRRADDPGRPGPAGRLRAAALSGRDRRRRSDHHDRSSARPGHRSAPAGHPQPRRPHRPAARGAGLPRPDHYRRHRDAGGGPALRPGRRHRAGAGRRRRRHLRRRRGRR